MTRKTNHIFHVLYFNVSEQTYVYKYIYYFLYTFINPNLLLVTRFLIDGYPYVSLFAYRQPCHLDGGLTIPLISGLRPSTCPWTVSWRS